MLNYGVELLAANDHEDLEMLITSWLNYEQPERIIAVQFVADGAEFTYCALFLYLKKDKAAPED